MVRLTVLYNLQPHIDEAEFLEWRLGEHQENNMSSPGVMRGYQRDSCVNVREESADTLDLSVTDS